MGMVTHFYNFLQNLSEEARGQNNVVLVVSIPASVLEMTTEDHSDHERFKKLLDRLGKAVMMSAEGETSEIIRRRLFEWNGVPEEAKKTINEYADWIVEHRNQAGDFPVDNAKESVWRTYNNIMLLGIDNKMRHTPLGLVHSSAADSLVGLIINRLRQDGDIEEVISPNFLIRNWPPAFKEWSTKSVRDAFFSSPQFPRLLNAETIRDTIARGVSGGNLGYVGKTGDGIYSPFIYGNSLSSSEVEITDNIFIIKKEIAEDYKEAKVTGSGSEKPDGFQYPTIKTPIDTTQEPGNRTQQPESSETNITSAVASSKLTWNGNIPPQKWMNFYTKVLSKFAGGKGLKLTLSVEVAEEGGISTQKIEETKAVLRELGLDDNVSNE